MSPVLLVLPAFNECRCLVPVIEEIADTLAPTSGAPDGRAFRILVIDDGSTDGTDELLPLLVERHGVRWLRIPERLGIGAATVAGLRYASANGFTRVVRLDADGQHDPADVPRLLAGLEGEDHFDAISGSRFLDSRSTSSSSSSSSSRAHGTPRSGRPMRRLSQWLLAQVLSAITGRRITDPTSGFWAFGERAIRVLTHDHPSGYPEPELHLLLRSHGLRVREVSVKMRHRIAGRSSLGVHNTVPFGARVLLAALIVPLRRPRPSVSPEHGAVSTSDQRELLPP